MQKLPPGLFSLQANYDRKVPDQSTASAVPSLTQSNFLATADPTQEVRAEFSQSNWLNDDPNRNIVAWQLRRSMDTFLAE